MDAGVLPSVSGDADDALADDIEDGRPAEPGLGPHVHLDEVVGGPARQECSGRTRVPVTVPLVAWLIGVASDRIGLTMPVLPTGCLLAIAGRILLLGRAALEQGMRRLGDGGAR